MGSADVAVSSVEFLSDSVLSPRSPGTIAGIQEELRFRFRYERARARLRRQYERKLRSANPNAKPPSTRETEAASIFPIALGSVGAGRILIIASTGLGSSTLE